MNSLSTVYISVPYYNVHLCICILGGRKPGDVEVDGADAKCAILNLGSTRDQQQQWMHTTTT